MQPKLAPTLDGDSELLCPSCGGNYLHHDRVDIYERGEDGSYGVHVAVEDGKATMDTKLQGNPSGRRHGLVIHLWCEACHARSTLNVAQHKGNTLIESKVKPAEVV